jgi:hypothetical protein
MRLRNCKRNRAKERSTQLVDGNVFSSKKISVVRTGRANIFRGITALLVLISWFLISNHCALGLAAIAHHQAQSVGKHDCCASNLPVQPEPEKDSGAPCCKTLLAISAVQAKLCQARIVLSVSATFDHAVVASNLPTHGIAGFQCIDVGPPGLTFAESVLQRSLRGHAPPFLA